MGMEYFLAGGRHTIQIKFRVEILVPKRQILHLVLNAVFRSALISLSMPSTLFCLPGIGNCQATSGKDDAMTGRIFRT